MPRSPCPDGQVRNKTTKRCRPSRGAKKTKKRKSPVKKVTFNVELRSSDAPFVKPEYAHLPMYQIAILEAKNRSKTTHSKELAAAVVDWYTHQGSWFVDNGYFKSAKFKHVKKSIYEVAYVPNEDESPQQLVDPDDDGNYPLEFDGKTYMVIGHSLK